MKLLFITGLLILQLNGAVSSPDEERLREALFKNYRKDVRPVETPEEVVNLTMNMNLVNVLDLDEESEIITFNAWIYMGWTDYRLKWDPTEFGGIESLRIPSSKIWTLDLEMYSSVTEKFSPLSETNAVVSSEGFVILVPPGVFESQCLNMYLKNFPNDKATCVLKFGSWTFSGLMVDIWNKNDTASFEDYRPNQKWDLIGAPASRHIKYYDCCPEPYVSIEYKLMFQRRHPENHCWIFVSALLMGVIAVLSHLLPTSSGEKIFLHFAVLFGFWGISTCLPRTQTYLGTYIARLGCVVVASLICSIGTICAANRTFKMRSTMRKILVDKLATGFGMGSLAVESEKNCEEWQFAARVMERICLITFAVIVTVLTFCFVF